MKKSKLLTLYASIATGVIVAASTATAAWTSVFIGTSSNNGAWSVSSGVHTISAAGAGVTGTTDNFRFAYDTTTLSGDCSITARILTASGGDNGWRQAGLMIRESTSGSSLFAASNILGTQGTRMTRRSAIGGSVSTSTIVSGIQPPYWLRVTRVASTNTFAAFRAPDAGGVPGTWVQTASISFSLGTNPVAGLYICSNSSTNVSTATFDNVTISSTGSGPAFVGMTAAQEVAWKLGSAPTDPNTAPTHYLLTRLDPTLETTSSGLSYATIYGKLRINPYTVPQPVNGTQFGITSANINGTYWSDGGTILHSPDDPVALPGITSFQASAQYLGAYALQPMIDPYVDGRDGSTHSYIDGTSISTGLKKAVGGYQAVGGFTMPSGALASSRAQGATANGGVMIWKLPSGQGVLGCISTQTGQGGSSSEQAYSDETANVTVGQEVYVYWNATQNKYRFRIPLAGDVRNAWLSNNQSSNGQPVQPGQYGYASLYHRTEYVFPPEKVLVDVALSTQNEFTFVTCYDTARNVGQVAVFANEGKNLMSAGHTMPYFGLISQGSFSSFKLLGYIDLSVKDPTYVSACSNNRWRSQSDTANLDLARIPLRDGMTLSCVADEAIPAGSQVNIYYSGGYRMRLTGTSCGVMSTAVAAGATGSVLVNATERTSFMHNFTTGSWRQDMAEGGALAIASRSEGKVIIYNLAALFQFFKSAWLTDAATHDATWAARNDARPNLGSFPPDFTARPDIKPTLEATFDLSASGLTPSAIRCSQRRGTIGGAPSGYSELAQREKLWVGTQEGTLVLYDISKLMGWSSDSPTPSSTVFESGRGFLGRNITHIACSRWVQGKDSPVLPALKVARGLSDAMDITCRGERAVYVVVTNGGVFGISQTFRDSRMQDPVASWRATRIQVLDVADYTGKQVVGFRYGGNSDPSDNHAWTAGIYDTTGDGYDVSGVLALPGKPFQLTSDNVN